MIDLTLNNGLTMPALGFGVFQSAREETTAAVAEALRDSDVPRDEVTVETKVWVSDYGYDETLHAFEKASGKLGLETLDLFILHQPAPDRFERTVAAYHALETLLRDGRVRAIGVSNFMPHHLQQLLREVDVIPAINQVELHPYFSQPDVRRENAEAGTVTQAWSPIGGITFYPGPWGDERRSVMQDATLAEIAQAHGKSPAQVMLRWHLQEGRSAIPKSTNPGRIAENFAVFDFELSEEELERINALDTGVRSGPDPDQGRGATWDRVIDEA
jgi:diketogulonate reductase-like aldo/keto reductase